MWCPVGDDGGSQAGWWLGGEEAQKELKPDVEEGVGGEQAMDTCEGPAAPLEPHSDARSLENIVMASGKLGGVAGVFLGVHICGTQEDVNGRGRRQKDIGPITDICLTSDKSG